MNPQKNYRRYRASVSIHGLDSSICRSTHSLAYNHRLALLGHTEVDLLAM
jgi:hypothetical protein